MIKPIIIGIISLVVSLSVQISYADDDLPLPEGKNIREWESISAALVSENRYEEAVIYLDKILDEEPENLKALSNKAGLLIQLENFSEGLEISNKVLEMDPERVSTLTNKAIALKMLEQYEQSFLVFTKILNIDPENKTVEKSRAKLLSITPTISTSDSEYLVHVMITVRNSNDTLIGVVESTNARYLPSLFTEKWWDDLDKKGKIERTAEGEIFTKTNGIIVEDNYIGMLSLEIDSNDYAVSIFETFLPIVQLEDTDTAEAQWTIIKN
tara:strand:- start:1258 stop:2064 length:807 start_codon:yes stop_codon:yes gene_type:complete